MSVLTMKHGEISLRLESGALHQQNTLWIHHQPIWIHQKGYVTTLKTIKHIGLIINQ